MNGLKKPLTTAPVDSPLQDGEQFYNKRKKSQIKDILLYTSLVCGEMLNESMINDTGAKKYQPERGERREARGEVHYCSGGGGQSKPTGNGIPSQFRIDLNNRNKYIGSPNAAYPQPRDYCTTRVLRI